MCLAIPGRILTVTGDDPLWRAGRVDFSGVVKEINLSCVPEAAVGHYVLVHAGLAISLLDEQEARAVLEQFRQIGEATTPPADDEPEPGPPKPPSPPASPPSPA